MKTIIRKHFKEIAKIACVVCSVGLFSLELNAQTEVVESGHDFTAVIDASGNLYTFGNNSSGQLGVADLGGGSLSAVQVLPAGDWVDVSASASTNGTVHVLAIQDDGSLWAWGNNGRGQLGDGSQNNSDVPVLVDDNLVWVEIAAGADFSIARTDDGTVYVWGDNTVGQLGREIDGNPAVDLSTIPIEFDAGNKYLSIAAGLQSGVGVRGVPGVDTTGKMYAWGFSNTLQLGQPSSSPSSDLVGPAYVPQKIVTQINNDSQDEWTRVESGAAICFAFRGGSLYTWGAAGHTGTTSSPNYTPVRVNNSTNWADVAIGGDHTLALKTNGRLFGWGSNEEYELGLPLQEPDGTVIGENYFKFTPVKLEEGSEFLAIGAGTNFSAIYSTGLFLQTSGVNNVGQLGNGLTSPAPQRGFKNSTLGQADLVAVSAEIVTNEPGPGDSIDVNFFIRNGGTGEIATPFEIAAVLSPTENFGDAGAVALSITSGGTVSTTLAPADEISVSVTLDLPASVDAGDYYLVLRADSTDLIEETFDIDDAGNNNDAAIEAEDVLSFIPDIQVVSSGIVVSPTSGAFPLQAGEEIDVAVTLTNEGTGSIPAGLVDEFLLRFVLSEVSDIEDASVVELTLTPPDETVVDEGMPVGGPPVVKNYTFTLPAFGVGSFYLGVQADSDDTVAEEDEDNNIAFTAAAIVEIAGIDIAEALDNFDLDFTTDGDGSWFGSDDASIVGASAFDSDAAVSPPLGEGESASILTEVTETSLVTFRWRSETGSTSNKLTFSLLGTTTTGTNNEISGSTDWITEERIVPAGAQAKWTYTEGSDSTSDRVFIDQITVVSVAEPDFVVDSAGLTSSGAAISSGRYILGTDRLDLAILIRNQGLTHPDAGADFDVRVYLSRDGVFNPPLALPAGPADDILVYSTTFSGAIDEGEVPILLPSIELPLDIPSDTYRLIVVVDESNVVEEVAEVPADVGADVQENNLFISEGEIIEIAALPNLRVSGVNPEPGFYLVGESYDFELTLENTGLSATEIDLSGPGSGLKVRIILSQDVSFDESDYVVGEFTFPANLSKDGATGSSATFDPDVADVRSDVPIADFLYFGVVVDSDNAVEEFDESDNTTFYPNPHFIFAEVEIEEAVEFDELLIAAQNNETVPFSDDKPFVGQTVETFDGTDAAQSSDIGDGQTASFQTTFTTETATVVSFNWKVSSELVVLDGGGVKSDDLVFYINDSAQATIAGEQDWAQYSTSVEAGTYTVRWSYEKDGSDAAGQDAGWVDNFQFRVPDLTITDLEVASQSLAPGATLDFTFNVTNVGQGTVPVTPSYTVDVRLSDDPIWGNTGDVVIPVSPELRSSIDLDPGESEAFTASVTIPAAFASADNFFLGLRVDPDPLAANSAVNGDGLIPESDNTNNTVFTDAAVVTVTPTITVSEGIDDEDADDPDPTVLPLVFGGEASWFGIDGVSEANLPDGTLQSDPGDPQRSDIAQSGPIEAFQESYFETSVVGPKVLKFRWKVDSSPSSNFLELDLNGILQESISGAVDWDFGFGSFTLTYLGQTTEPIPSDATAQDVEDALNALGTITASGGVTVMLDLVDGVYDYFITFVENGNRPLISFEASDSNRIANAVVSTSLNGNSGLPETQAVTIEPSVFFILSFEGETTGQISYLADAQAVEDALNGLSSITSAGGVTVSNHPEAENALDFLVSFNSFGERDLVQVNAVGLRQPVTVENELDADRFKPGGSLGIQGVDGTTAQVQPLRIGPEITLFVPAGAGAQTIRWTYRKSGNAGDYADAGWVDQVRFLDFAQPELAIASLDYAAGTYVLDVTAISGQAGVKLGTETLDISVTAQNQGTDLPPEAGSFTASDIEVRLSEDQIYGNADDIVLGTFAQSEGTLTSGELMAFIGGLPLGDHIPENDYYLIVKVDANERIDEFSDSNNIVISDNRDVTIERRARLRPFDLEVAGVSSTEDAFLSDVMEYDEDILYRPLQPMRVRFDIQNVGLDNLFDENGQVIEFLNEINIYGIKRAELDAFGVEATATDIVDASTVPIRIGDFTISQAMEGRREAEPDGDIISLDLELFLPNTLDLLSILDDGDFIQDYVYYLELVIDSNDAVPESGIVNRWLNIDSPVVLGAVDDFDALDIFTPFEDVDDGLFSIVPGYDAITEAIWETTYGVTANEAGDATQQANFLAYAFARDPNESDTAGNQFPGTYGFTEIDAEEYLSITFDIVAGATDLIYEVEVADDPGFAGSSILVTIDATPTGFVDLVGPASLTGDGGLINEPQVISVVGETYSARVTVIDTQPVSAGSSRFMRVNVTSNP